MPNEFKIKNGLVVEQGPSQITGSLDISGSTTIQGTTTITGSLLITGSTTQIGTNTLLGNTLLSGSLTISGTLGQPNPTISIFGDLNQKGYIRFLPVTTNLDTSISASYIYVSGSTNDLYFSQNGSGYNNVTRLRWLEGNLYTGLLHGGIIGTASSTVYTVSSGSGVIVTMNASYNDNPYPTVQYVNWDNLSASIAPLSASFDQSFISINSSNAITAQGVPYTDGQYDTLIPVGIVLHQNGSTINGVQTFPSVAYGWKQRSFDFIKAFGPLKISGYTLSPSGSSTRGLLLAGGTSWVDGRNYTINPNSPSYITEAVGIATSKIYRYRQSGSEWVYDTNAGAGYTDIDPTQYSLNGVLTPVPTNHFTIQRVFYFPNSPTKALFVYYGNAQYANQADALAAVSTETFTEAPNTAANSIYVGYMLLRHNANFTTPASFTIQPAGLFRAAGIGGGGGGGSTTPGGSDTQIQYNNAGGFGGVPTLTYNGTTLSATGSFTGSFIGSLEGTASYALSSSYAVSASYINNISPAIANNVNNQVLTATGTGAINGESNMTFDGAALTVTARLQQGNSTTASADNSHAQGDRTLASGLSSHAEGYFATASGDQSHAEGINTTAQGSGAHAEGSETVASGVASHTEGDTTQAIGDFSHAEGDRTIASAQASHAEGYQSQAQGTYSHAEGYLTDAQGNGAHAEGESTIALGIGSHAEGQSTQTDGDYSHAEGESTIALGIGSHAEGQSTQTDGDYSHAEGSRTAATGVASHAEGSRSVSTGEGSHAEGFQTEAIGNFSHAEGTNTIATGDYSHAEGSNTQTIGSHSHAEGLGTVASGSYQHVQGQFNISSSAQSAFIVGNGTADNARSNLVFASGSTFQVTGSIISTQGFTGSLFGTASFTTTASYALNTPPTFIDNLVTVGLAGSDTDFTSIKSAVDSITDSSQNNTYTVRVYPGVYIEDTITVPTYVSVKGDSSTTTVVSASNPNAGIFIMSDQSMVIDMQIQGSTGTGASAIFYSSPTTPQTNAIAYAENIRFGTNYTNATCAGSGSGNCILQCSNVKYGGFTSGSKSFDIGFRVTGSGGSIGRMQLRNVTSTNGGVAGTDNNQIFALADAPGCTFIVNGCLLTRATGTARGTGFKVYNGGQLRLTAVNFQRWINGIWAPQTGSAPSIDAIALNFENCTTDVLIEHTGSIGKVSGTDNFLKTQIALDAPLYEVGQDPRKISVAKKGGDFTSISASVAYITDSSENNRYIIEVGPGQFTEKTIDLTGKPYVSIVGSNIQATQIFPSSSNQHIIKMGINNEVSFLSLANAGTGYSAIYVDDIGDFAQAHKVSIYDCDRGITVNASTTDTQFYGEYVDINGTFTYGTYVSSSNGAYTDVSMENYFLFPSASATVGNFVSGPSSSLGVRSAVLTGDGTVDSIAFQLQEGATLEGSSIDIPYWDTAIYVPNIGSGPTFRLVGTMIHNSLTYDFDIQNPTTIGRFQGISDHSKINNVSEDFYWNFLDDTDGENDVTRKLSVTFADGTHTDATTLIFKGSPMGVMQGGMITISGSLTINAAAGFGYLENSINPDIYQRIDWVDSTLALSPNTDNYIYFTNASTLTAAGSTPDSTQNIILGRVVTNTTGIEFIDQSPYDGAHTSNKLSKFNREALGPVFSDGSIITEDVTPFKLDVTQGSYFFSENNFTPAGTSSINLNQYYISGSGWNTSTSSIVPNNVYASGSQLIPMSSSYYTKHTVYLVGDGVDEKYFLVINDNQYSALVAAENASLPTIPTYFSDGVVPLAAVYVQSGSANITQIQDIRPVIGFRAAGVNASSVHGNLLGLSADDHTQYLLVNGTRQMSGDLGLGGNKLTNFSIVSGSNVTTTNITASVGNITSITGSLFGTSSWATNAVNASNITVTSDNTTNSTYYPILSPSSSGAVGARVDSSTLTYNPSTDTLTTGDLSLALGGSRTLTMQAQGAGGTEIKLLPNSTAGYARINVGNTLQPLDFQMNSNDVLRIAQDGKVGIGTTGATAKLEVRGTGATLTTTALLVQNSSLSDLFKVTDGGDVSQGAFTTANGGFSHAEGLGTVASGLYQHVQGRYNISSSAQSAFIIGNGTGTGGSRSNLVFASGSEFQITGSLLVTGSISASRFIGDGSQLTNLPAGGGINTGSFATTGSNTFIGNQIITGSLNVSGSITGTFPTNLATARFEMGISSTAVITTGVKGRKTVPYTGTIVGWKLISDTNTTTVLDIWKTNNAIPTVANSITAGAKPSLTAAQLSTSTTLTGWTTSVSPNDVFILNVDSNDNATYISLELDILLS